MNRRDFSLGLAALGVLAACGPGEPQGRVIRVGILGASWTDRLARAVKPAMDAAGISATYLAGGAEEWLPRLIAARRQSPPVDVVEVDEQTTADLLKAGLLLELDHAKLPNLRDLDPSMFNAHRVAYWAAEQALIYNADKFRQAGIPAPRRYSDLADPRLAGRVLFPDIAHYSSTFAILGLVYENGGDEARLAPGFEVFARIKPHSYVLTAAPLVQLFQSGDAWAAPFAAHIAVRLADAGVDVAVSHPPVAGRTAMIAHGCLAITKGCRDVDAAHRFIDAAIATGVQKTLFDETAIIPTNTRALEAAVAAEDTGRVPRASLMALDLPTIASGWAPDFDTLDRREFVRLWQSAVDAQMR